jgi:hypothetical protein
VKSLGELARCGYIYRGSITSIKLRDYKAVLEVAGVDGIRIVLFRHLACFIDRIRLTAVGNWVHNCFALYPSMPPFPYCGRCASTLKYISLPPPSANCTNVSMSDGQGAVAVAAAAATSGSKLNWDCRFSCKVTT